MHRRSLTALATALALVGSLAAQEAWAQGRFKTRLSGLEEVPALSSPGSGEFTARIHDGTIDYTLSYEGLESGVLFAHIHLGQRGVNGGVSVFLCSNAPAPVSTPACPTPGGSVSGTLGAADVVGPAAQGIEAGEIEELLEAVVAGATYVNVHTNDFPGGELRGQIRRGIGPLGGPGRR